jgi:hypothetical protein
VEAINRVLAKRVGHRLLVRKGHRFSTRFVSVSEEPIQLLVPVAESAAELLEHGERLLIKQCENPSCVLYFYDTTKNRSRRWCSMEPCGNRIKAAAYYRRMRARNSGTRLPDPRRRPRTTEGTAKAPSSSGQEMRSSGSSKRAPGTRARLLARRSP